jgi:transaldolase
MSTTTPVNPRLLALSEAGVSVWLDQIRRSLVESGELARMIAEDCLRGVTANPSIFEKAILGSTDYDDELESFAEEQLDALAIYERIATATCRPQRTCCPTFTANRTGTTGSSHWRCPRIWRTTPTARSSRPATIGGGSTART